MTPLHITNGDSAAGTLRSFLTDRVLVTCDVLHDGPAPLVDDAEWYETRARFLTEGFGPSYDETRASLARFDRMAGDARGEIVLWFEHDLFDQLLLIRTLDVIRRRHPDRDRGVSLICIDRFPGVERFVGLGQLDTEQLASLYPGRQPIGPAHFAIASEAWRAFRSSDPRELFDLMIHRDWAPLPFLRQAIHRFFEEYPSATNGLSRSARAVLGQLASRPLDGMSLFAATQRDEPQPFLGDLGFLGIVAALATARVPLVAANAMAVPDLRRSPITLTDAGRDVLAGRADAVALNGIDEWRGGVHLAGHDRSPWRWDAAAETLVS